MAWRETCAIDGTAATVNKLKATVANTFFITHPWFRTSLDLTTQHLASPQLKPPRTPRISAVPCIFDIRAVHQRVVRTQPGRPQHGQLARHGCAVVLDQPV